MEGERKLLVVVHPSDPSIQEAKTRRLTQIQGHLWLNNDYHGSQSYTVRCCLKEKQGGVVTVGMASELVQGKGTCHISLMT